MSCVKWKHGASETETETDTETERRRTQTRRTKVKEQIIVHILVPINIDVCPLSSLPIWSNLWSIETAATVWCSRMSLNLISPFGFWCCRCQRHFKSVENHVDLFALMCVHRWQPMDSIIFLFVFFSHHHHQYQRHDENSFRWFSVFIGEFNWNETKETKKINQ